MVQRARPSAENISASARYVNPDVVGSEDLDQYGTWKDYPDYGAVWTPTTVAAGLGAVQLRALDLGESVGLDLGG